MLNIEENDTIILSIVIEMDGASAYKKRKSVRFVQYSDVDKLESDPLKYCKEAIKLV